MHDVKLGLELALVDHSDWEVHLLDQLDGRLAEVDAIENHARLVRNLASHSRLALISEAPFQHILELAVVTQDLAAGGEVWEQQPEHTPAVHAVGLVHVHAAIYLEKVISKTVSRM